MFLSTLSMASAYFTGYSSKVTSLGKEVDDYYAFGDIWCLDLDIPEHNGHFDEKMFEDSISLKVGAFRCCIQCKKTRMDYFLCQGTCRGKGIYCSKECQHRDWKTHEGIYSCHKM